MWVKQCHKPPHFWWFIHVYTTHLWWYWGWFMIVLTTLIKDQFFGRAPVVPPSLANNDGHGPVAQDELEAVRNHLDQVPLTLLGELCLGSGRCGPRSCKLEQLRGKTPEQDISSHVCISRSIYI
jgi:hypothetical protein